MTWTKHRSNVCIDHFAYKFSLLDVYFLSKTRSKKRKRKRDCFVCVSTTKNKRTNYNISLIMFFNIYLIDDHWVILIVLRIYTYIYTHAHSLSLFTPPLWFFLWYTSPLTEHERRSSDRSIFQLTCEILLRARRHFMQLHNFHYASSI